MSALVLVGDEGGVAIAGRAVEDRELGAGMGPLAADDQAGALGPSGEVDAVGQLCDLGALALGAVAVDRLSPGRLRQAPDRLANPLVDLVADREADAGVAAVGGEGVGAPADVGAGEDLAVEVRLGQLLQGQLQHLEVIGGGVGGGVAGPQDRRPAARLSRPGSRAAGGSRSRPCSCRRRLPSRSGRPAARRRCRGSAPRAGLRHPRPGQRLGAGGADRFEQAGVDRLEHPVGGRLRGHRPEQRLLAAQNAEVRDVIAAVGDRHGEVAQDDAGVVGASGARGSAPSPPTAPRSAPAGRPTRPTGRRRRGRRVPRRPP